MPHSCGWRYLDYPSLMRGCQWCVYMCVCFSCVPYLPLEKKMIIQNVRVSNLIQMVGIKALLAFLCPSHGAPFCYFSWFSYTSFLYLVPCPSANSVMCPSLSVALSDCILHATLGFGTLFMSFGTQSDSKLWTLKTSHLSIQVVGLLLAVLLFWRFLKCNSSDLSVVIDTTVGMPVMLLS